MNNVNPPINLPTEPADMFAGVEKDDLSDSVEKTPDALGAGLLKKKDSMPNISSAPMTAPSLYEVKQPILGKVLLFLIIAVVLGAVIFGGWYAYNKFTQNKPITAVSNIKTTVQSQPIIDTTTAVKTPVLPVEEKKVEPAIVTTSFSAPTSSDVTTKMNNDKILFGEAVDSDKDGLDDVREKELGTNPFKADTDGDGLSDGDEVIIWKTNPLNPDTDGDSYKDGDEVRNGYNPLGPGKLFNVPAGVSTSTATSSKIITDVKNKK